MTQTIFTLAIIALLLVGINLLPNISSYPTITDGITTIAGYMKAWNFIFPIDVLFICVVIVTITEFGIWTFKGTRWVLHFLRGHQ